MQQYFADGISFKPHCAIGYTFCLNQNKRSLIPKSNISIGVLSRKARAKMVNAINWMVYLSEGKKYYDMTTKKYYPLKLNFITLTLCAEQMHDDKYIKQHLLEPFLKWMKRKGNNLYVWRAETQANNNLHFHITSNKYLDKTSIRNKWNSLLQKHGYLKLFFEKHGHHDPNSTDVKGVKSPHKMAAYMVKYMSKKNEGRRDVTCKVWSCSTALMNKRRNVTELDNYWKKFYDYLQNNSDSIQIGSYKLFTYNSMQARNILLEEQVIHEAYEALNLWNEKAYCKRIPGQLGAISTKDQRERSVYMPTLWEQTERQKERPQKLLPCYYISSPPGS